MHTGPTRAHTCGVTLLGHKVCASSTLPGDARLWLHQFTLPAAAGRALEAPPPQFLGVVCRLYFQRSQRIFLLVV